MDQETFLTPLYVMIDDFCQSAGFAEKHRPGPAASRSCSEVVTLAIVGQWGRFPSERAFSRSAQSHVHAAFPTLPAREQFNRLQRGYREAIVAFSQCLVEPMQAQRCLYEVLDSSGIPTRDAKRRGTGCLAGQADIGGCTRLGWYEGFHLLCAITPQGVMTGFGFASASTHDQPLAETFFAARVRPVSGLLTVGSSAQGVYLADKGFAGEEPHTQWRERYGADVLTAPHQRSKKQWSKDWRRWLAGLRQISETISDTLLHTFPLARERPHDLTGFQARERPKSPCIMVAFGSTSNWVVNRWPLPACSTGNLDTSIHTKR